MSNWYNDTGRPLASDDWLEAHHQAKLPERSNFANLIAQRSPRRIVDLGCGPGLWLQLLSSVVSRDCQLHGIDTDEGSLNAARFRASAWSQSSEFTLLDLETQAGKLPDSDVFLAFNIFPYITNPLGLLSTLKSKLRPGGCLVVRQYDGALLRMGPMNDRDRHIIDTSLMTSVMGSGQFKHYDLDRVFHSLATSSFNTKAIEFEVFRRVAPYPVEFQSYLTNTIEWTRKYISNEARDRLDAWCRKIGQEGAAGEPSYFMEVDLVAWLS